MGISDPSGMGNENESFIKRSFCGSPAVIRRLEIFFLYRADFSISVRLA